MWNYEKRLQYPVNIKTPNAKLAQFISSQYGGPDGEIGASMRYLSQRFTAPNRMVAAVLNDVGTEELAHGCYHYVFSWIFGKISSRNVILSPSRKAFFVSFVYRTLSISSLRILFLVGISRSQ